MAKSGLAAGDYDDGDVGMADYTLFQGCYNGANRPSQQSGCEESDIDDDGDVDATDFTLLQGCYNGPDRPPTRGSARPWSGVGRLDPKPEQRPGKPFAQCSPGGGPRWQGGDWDTRSVRAPVSDERWAIHIPRRLVLVPRRIGAYIRLTVAR
jgi:hypothetical protein